MFTVFRKEIVGKKWSLYFLEPTKRSSCQTITCHKEQTEVVLCRTRPVSQNVTGPIHTKQRDHRRTQNDCFEVRPNSKLRSMATEEAITLILTTMKSLDFLQAQFWDHSHKSPK